MLTILVNGLPGAGKTTLAKSLAAELGLPLFSRDAVKETLADTLQLPDRQHVTSREWSRALGAAAAEVLWTLLAQATTGAILEGLWLRNVRDFTLAGLARAGVADIQEVWCQVPLAVARRRFNARTDVRHPIHLDDQPDSEQRWLDWSLAAEPVGLGRVHQVDTSGAVDVAALAEQIRACASRLDQAWSQHPST